jgi:hypothetical protein
MTAHSPAGPLDVKHDDLEIVGQGVTLRFPPGTGEADRVAHVRKLLEVSAELRYAISPLPTASSCTSAVVRPPAICATRRRHFETHELFRETT